jgi:hypothetical protein
MTPAMLAMMYPAAVGPSQWHSTPPHSAVRFQDKLQHAVLWCSMLCCALLQFALGSTVDSKTSAVRSRSPYRGLHRMPRRARTRTHAHTHTHTPARANALQLVAHSLSAS